MLCKCCWLLALLLLACRAGLAQRSTQEVFMMQYLERRMAQLEERLNRCEHDIQSYEQKLYDLSKETRAQLLGLNVYKAEIKGQVDGVVMRLERVERDVEYLDNHSPSQPCVDIDEKLLEQQVKDAQLKEKQVFTLKTDCSLSLRGVKSLKIVLKEGDTQGSWLKDPTKGSAKVYFFSGTRNGTLLEFPSLKSFVGGNFSQGVRQVSLPYPWQGTGHAVYHGFLYYHRADTLNEVVKVNLRNRTLADQLLLQGAGKLPVFDLNPHTLVQLAVDELGLWAIHADPDFGGNLVVTKLDASNLAVEHAWDTTCSSRDAEAAFLVCGKLYVVYNSRLGGRSSVQCLFDIHDSLQTEVGTSIFFPKRYASHSSMHYHPKDKQIYAWDDGYQTIYKLDI